MVVLIVLSLSSSHLASVSLSSRSVSTSCLVLFARSCYPKYPPVSSLSLTGLCALCVSSGSPLHILVIPCLSYYFSSLGSLDRKTRVVPPPVVCTDTRYPQIYEREVTVYLILCQKLPFLEFRVAVENGSMFQTICTLPVRENSYPR